LTYFSADRNMYPRRKGRHFRRERFRRNMSEQTVISNQKQILKNQKTILSNQAQIKANQDTIKKNQASILKNQASLNTIIKNQQQILALLKKS
jgi:hypothetical protein